MLFPLDVPTFTVPADTLNSPVLSVHPKAPAFTVPPLFQNPAFAPIVTDVVNGLMVDALDSLNVPLVITKGLAAPDSAMSDVASRIRDCAHLSTFNMLNVEVEVPEIVCKSLVPLKSTVPTPAVNEPLLVQLPETERL